MTPSNNSKRSSSRNRILDRLAGHDYEQLAPSLESASLALKQELYRFNEPFQYVYFPIDGMISLVTATQDGREVETGTIGNEGMLGYSLALGMETSPLRAICQVPCSALAVPTAVFVQALRQSPALDTLVRRYVAVVLRQFTQSIACNALHGLESRLCRWLLMTHDRAGADEFSITQEFLAEMLGVRRPTVTVVAGALQESGLISYRRGILRILDRPGLENASCECYRVVRNFYERTL
jgi:CRP-like cAMP-binding protein